MNNRCAGIILFFTLLMASSVALAMSGREVFEKVHEVGTKELDRKTDQWAEPKASIVRFKKWNGSYRKQSSFNISSAKQAAQIVDVIGRWYKGAAGDDEAEAAGETLERDEG